MRLRFVVMFASVLAALLLSLPVMTSAQSHVGVESTIVDLGTLERGTENVATFRLVTTTQESFLVNLYKEPGSKDFFLRPSYSGLVVNYSEEAVMNWVELVDDFAVLDVLEEKTGIVGAYKEVNFFVNVPEDAEPGYHVFRVKPIPAFTGETVGQVGTRVISITSVNFLFNVVGNALRDGIILDVVSKPIGSNRLFVDTYFQNTGTTTMTAHATQTMYKNGEIVEKAESARELVEPGRMKALRVPFRAENFAEGEYEVHTTVDFLTDTVSKNSTIMVGVPTAPPEEEEEPEPFPWYIIILIVVIVIAVMIYKW